MIISTEAIVTHTTLYSDSKIIIHCYSQMKGKIAFMHYRSKSKRKQHTPYFYPLAVMTFFFRDNDKKTLHTLSNYQHSYIHHSILNNPLKRSIALFLGEFLNIIIKDEDTNQELFAFMLEGINVLDNSKDGYQMFHLKFLLDASKFTGFFPELNFYTLKKTNYFDLYTGEFTATRTDTCISYEDGLLLQSLTQTKYENLSQITTNKLQISTTLDSIIKFYTIHFPDFRQPRAIQIFRDF